MTVIVGVAWAERELAHADQWAEYIAARLPQARAAMTHVVDVGSGRGYAVTVDLLGEPPTRETISDAAPETAAVVVAHGTPVDWDEHGVELFRPAARAAIRARLAGSGRATVFDGQDRLCGTVTVGDAVTLTAIDRVQLLGSGAGFRLDDATLLVTRDFARPILDHGDLVLFVTPLADGSVEPFERRNPHQCCADH